MKLTVNGTAQQIVACDLAAALVELGYGPDARVATAINETFVPAGQRAGHALSDGDRLEILAPRQGG